MIRRQAAGRHDTVHMGMADEGLAPCVEDAEATDLRPQMTRVGGDLAQRGRARLEEPAVDTTRIAVAERQERVWQREDDVHIRDVEELALSRREPPLAGLRLTLRTVSIPTRVIGDSSMSAGATLIEMPAERGRPTSRQRAQHGPLLHAQPRMPLEEWGTLRVEDIGHLHGGPAHDCGGLRSRRERGTIGGVATCSCSSGFGAPCR
jgi:hypothetical protein